MNLIDAARVEFPNLLGRVLIEPCVCFEAQTGKHLLVLSLTAFDPKATSRVARANLRESTQLCQYSSKLRCRAADGEVPDQGGEQSMECLSCH